MRLGEEIRRQRKERGLSLRDMEPLTGLRYVTINDVELEKGKNGPLLNTIKLIARGGKFDIHRIAHAAFDLPEPEQLGELDDLLKELCDRVMNLSEEDRKSVLTYVKTLTRMRQEEQGGGADITTQDAQAGFG
ncbi:MAG: helix-turn-helix transcriptional regulator [Actinobacteria bacterium]|nr:helix-turn-helix transcriptional regulator [Actinomycetota bacterium]